MECSIKVFGWMSNGMTWLHALYFENFKNHISKFQKILKINEDIDYSALQQRENFQLKIDYITSYRKITKSDIF